MTAKQSHLMDMPTKLSNIADDILEQGMQLALEDKQAMVNQLTPTVPSNRFG